MEITQENISKLEEENIRLKKDLEDYKNASEVMGEAKEMFSNMCNDREERLKKANLKIFKLERKFFIEQGKRWMVEWEVHCLKKEIKKLKRRQKNA